MIAAHAECCHDPYKQNPVRRVVCFAIYGAIFWLPDAPDKFDTWRDHHRGGPNVRHLNLLNQASGYFWQVGVTQVELSGAFAFLQPLLKLFGLHFDDPFSMCSSEPTTGAHPTRDGDSTENDHTAK
eukprot:8013206-Pyramimonas_sp.AAC.2